MANENSEVYGISGKDADRLRRTNDRAEQEPRNKLGARGARGRGWTGLLPAKNGATALAGGSIATPGSGTVTLMVPAGNGFTATGGDSVTCYNPFAGSVAANKLLWVTWFNGNFYVASSDC